MPNKSESHGVRPVCWKKENGRWKEYLSYPVIKQDRDSKTLFVGGLAPEVGVEFLQDIFPDSKEIRIPQKSRKDGHRGVAYIQFESAAEVASNLEEKQGIRVKGKPIFLDKEGNARGNGSGLINEESEVNNEKPGEEQTLDANVTSSSKKALARRWRKLRYKQEIDLAMEICDEKEKKILKRYGKKNKLYGLEWKLKDVKMKRLMTLKLMEVLTKKRRKELQLGQTLCSLEREEKQLEKMRRQRQNLKKKNSKGSKTPSKAANRLNSSQISKVKFKLANKKEEKKVKRNERDKRRALRILDFYIAKQVGKKH